MEKSGPVGLLSLMNSASIVLVQSFHGIVFSALFHKTFWSLRNKVIKMSTMIELELYWLRQDWKNEQYVMMIC